MKYIFNTFVYANYFNTLFTQTYFFMDFSEITTLGVGGIATAILTFILNLLRRSEFRDFAKLGLKNLFKAIVGKEDHTHRVFYNAEKYKLLVRRISFPGEALKTILFRELLITKINVSVSLITAWLDKPATKKLLRSNHSKMQLQSELMMLIQDIVETYEKLIPEAFFKIVEDRKKANEFFKIAYDGVCLSDCPKYKESKIRCDDRCEKTIGFKVYHEKNIDFINRFLETIPESEGEKNRVLFSFFLNYADGALYSAVYDARKVFANQNGRYRR